MFLVCLFVFLKMLLIAFRRIPLTKRIFHLIMLWMISFCFLLFNRAYVVERWRLSFTYTTWKPYLHCNWSKAKKWEGRQFPPGLWFLSISSPPEPWLTDQTLALHNQSSESTFWELSRLHQWFQAAGTKMSSTFNCKFCSI